MQTQASVNTIATFTSGWPLADVMAFSEATPQAPQDSNPFHFEDSQVVLQVSHNIVSYVPIRVLFELLLVRR
jgi:hypothetical protein